MDEIQSKVLTVERNVVSFQKLLEEGELVPDTDGFSETPLHTSAMLGNLEVTRRILSQKPELAKGSDFRGASPLHLATANGHLEVVKELLSVNADMCLAPDIDGRNPLHIAVIKGRRLGVLKELVRSKPEAVFYPTDKGDTILHLCVKHYEPEALMFLVKTIKDNGFINQKDADGSTILHLAVADREIEIINFLIVETAIEVNAVNASGFTALDIAVAQGRRNLKDIDIQDSLKQFGALSAKDTMSSSESENRLEAVKAMNLRSINNGINRRVGGRSRTYGTRRQDDEEGHLGIGKKQNAIMIAASLIATMTFQAGTGPPSGSWQDDNGQEAGRSIMAYKVPVAYSNFVAHNTTAFLASISVILLLISGLPFQRRITMWILTVIMWVAITESTFSYLIAMYCQSINRQRKTFGATVFALGVVLYGVLSFLLVGHSVRWIPKIAGFAKWLKTPSPSPRLERLYRTSL